MSATTVLDPRPLDYRNGRIARAVIADDVATRLGTDAGAWLRLTTSRGRSVIVTLTDDEEAPGAGLVRIDRFCRQSLKAFPHEELTAESVSPGPAKELGLVPCIDLSQRYDASLVPELRRVLVEQRVAVRPGMLLYVPIGDRLAGMNYNVHYVEAPDGEGAVHEGTTIWLIDPDHDHHGAADHDHDHDGSSETVMDTTFEDVGGLTLQIREIREFVELPLVFPQVYRQLGISPPRGVIFQGAPGTGKTLLARSVANEINAQLFYINGPEVIGTFSGETETNLRKIFAEASLRPPSIVLIDELDAIAPSRRAASSHSDARAVTQLLALLDGLHRAEGVIVIGTTNRIEALDPALRRAGRFDREIYFPTPGPDARDQILRVQTRDMPLDDEATTALPSISERAHGFVGADLMELAREAGLNSLRRASTKFIETPSVANYPAPEDLIVTADDFESALADVRPAAMRESLITFPAVGWTDVGGLEHIKRKLRELVGRPLHEPWLFDRVGLATSLGVVLHGPPGTGKTLLAQAVARESGVNFIALQGPELFSQWLGESEASVRHVFDIASRSQPCLIFFDQLDSVLPSRRDLELEGTRAPQRVANQLLAELDGMETRGRVAVMGATNRLEAVDPAALRPGRFGVHLHVGRPGDDERAAILRIHLERGSRHFAWTEGLVDELVRRTDSLVGAQLAFLCQSAKMAAFGAARAPDEVPLQIEHFEATLQELTIADISTP